MAHDCTICAFELNEYGECAACNAAEAIIQSGVAHPNLHEALAEKIGDILRGSDWMKVYNLSQVFPRF